MDMLNFGDEHNASSGDMLCNISPMMDFSQPRQFFDGNADLNSLFLSTGLTPKSGLAPRTGFTPRTGMTPLDQDAFANDMAQYFSWNNGADMFSEQGSYFPQQPPVQETAMAESLRETVMSPISEASGVPNMPKRGRPRKSRAKKQMSDEQEQDKRQRFLERNRQAASRCRERRKDWTSKLDEMMKLEQIKSVGLRAEYEILSQEVHNLLGVIHQHNDAGCHSEYLKTFLMTESSRYLAILVEPGRRASKDSIVLDDLDHGSATSTPRAGSIDQNSQGSEAGDSGITNMGSPKKLPSETSDQGYDDGLIMMMAISCTDPATNHEARDGAEVQR